MSSIPSNIKKCVDVLKAAKNDTEKFAALFMAAKLTKGDDCRTDCKKLLFEAIGAGFLGRLLSSDNAPTDCPPEIYKSVALSVLSSFCTDKTVAALPSMVSLVPMLFQVVQKCETDDSDENLIVVSEAYKCILCILDSDAGLKALYDAGGIIKVSDVYLRQSFESDKALNILVKLLTYSRDKPWTGNEEKLKDLLNRISLDFRTDNSEKKFELCNILLAILMSVSKNDIPEWEGEMWPTYIREGLKSILTSKITKQMRDPALKLVSVVVNLLGVEWALIDEEKPKQFLLLLIHLCSVEVRMQLEDRSLKEILSNSELVVACFLVLEITMMFISSESIELDSKEKQQLYISLKGAFAAIVATLKTISKDFPNGTANMEFEMKLFVSATIRALAAWMSQDPSALRDSITDLIPFILTFANETFYSYRSNYILKSKSKHENGASQTQADKDSNAMNEVNILRLLLPGMCHLTVDNKARRTMLDIKQADVLLDCFMFHWSVVDYKKPPVPKSERLKAKPADVPLAPEILEEIKDSREALVSLCNIFMNITVLETEIAESNPLFATLFKFIVNSLIDLKSTPENLVLQGNMCVLGLLLLKQQAQSARKTDFSLSRFLQSTIVFLWDAYNIDESNDSSTFVVSMAYKKYWIELMELWFLGMQTFSHVMKQITWVSELVSESGWFDGMIKTLVKVRPGSLPPNVKSCYEDFLSSMIEADKSLIAALKKNDEVLNICRSHRFMEFGKKIFGN